MIHGSLTIADYVILALSCFFVILGLFRGASGLFSLVSASVISFASGVFLWERISAMSIPPWAHVVAVLLAGLVVFGIVRIVVKKTVNCLLAQPADSIFGLLLGLTTSALLIYIVATVPLAHDYSVISREMAPLIKAGRNVR